MFPPTISTSDPDPTTQVPWPGRGPTSPVSPTQFRDPLLPSAEQLAEQQRREDEEAEANAKVMGISGGEHRMSLLDFVNISVSMAGAQIAWTFELGYGTPFLLDLGLSEQLTSLVWLAGPISGLIAQPLIGAISDSSASRYRRRFWIVASTVIVVISMLVLAYAKEIASFFVDLFAPGVADWDPERKIRVDKTAIGIAIACFYFLDFALNALQASLRNLLLDRTPADQLATGNAWHGRMIHAGNIIGFTFGFLPLEKWPILRSLGGKQVRKVCVVSVLILVATVWVTSYTQDEKARDQTFGKQERKSRFRDVMLSIYNAIVKLPRPVRRVCYVQVFAFMGWFPFLFYSTTWVGEILAYEIDAEPTSEEATKKGEFAMLLYSIVSVAAGTLLPYLATRDRRLLKVDETEEDEDEDEEISRIREMVSSWKREAARMGRPLRLPWMPFMLRNIWTAALLLFGVIMMSTFFITTVVQATIAISLLGICWAVACWVPFAIIMEYLKELDKVSQDKRRHPALDAPAPNVRPVYTRTVSSPALWRGASNPNERTTLIRRHSLHVDYEAEAEAAAEAAPVAGGTILGIHNLAIVFPQFIIAIVASAIFRMVDVHQGPGNDNVYYGKNGVSWVLRFGGVCAFLGALASRAVAPTKTEREMRRRLAEMKESTDGESP